MAKWTPERRADGVRLEAWEERAMVEDACRELAGCVCGRRRHRPGCPLGRRRTGWDDTARETARARALAMWRRRTAQERSAVAGKGRRKAKWTPARRRAQAARMRAIMKRVHAERLAGVRSVSEAQARLLADRGMWRRT